MKFDISISKTTNPKPKPDSSNLEFGTKFTDHMFICDYNESMKENQFGGWHNARIVPYAPIEIDPAAAVLHYAQEMFEGLKAYRGKDGSIMLFRPDMNAKRTNKTNDRICIPKIDEEAYVDAIEKLVDVDRDWMPDAKDTSLYIRPFIIATEAFVGVRPAHEYKFIIILSPVGPYYKGGLQPTKIYVEDEYVRATVGGTGEAKIGGNYAMSLKGQMKAYALGFTQVLWLDGVYRKYVEEIGTSNAFFVIDGEIFTPPLEGTILPGITRASVITLLKEWGMSVREEKLTIEDVFAAHSRGSLSEMFASGTAAVISPVGELKWSDKDIIINNGEIGQVSQRLYDTITGIQRGYIEDTYNWTVKL